MTIDARFRLHRVGFELDVALRLPARGVSVVFGPSGCGKTTLLRCMAGLERAAVGELRFKGAVWQDDHTWLPAHRRPLGYVFQEASLLEHLSVAGNLRYGMRRRPGSNAATLEQVVALLDLDPLLARMPAHLSGGERQRVAIARALAANPCWVLMDEPLASLDAARKREILPYLERLHAELDIPVVYVTHAADEAARLGDHLVVMRAGKVVASGPLAATLANLESPVTLDDDLGVVLEAVVVERDQDWHLLRVYADGVALWLPDHSAAVIGQRLRLRVLARDVSVATERPARSSILNVLHGHIDAIADDLHPGSVLVRVQSASASLLARVTRRSAAALNLAVGQGVWLQVKSVALLD